MRIKTLQCAFVLIGVVMQLFACVAGVAQGDNESIVFKNTKKRPGFPTLVQSDATLQIWETFLVVRKAHAGEPLAQHELGLRYLLGRGFEADTANGAYWIRKAAEQNLIPARFNMGILQFHGWGVSWSPFDACRNFLYCAEKEMAAARFIMGLVYTENLIVPRDMRRAYHWLTQAADSGYTPAKRALAEIEKYRAIENVGSSQKDLVFLGFDEDTTSHNAELSLLNEALRGAGPTVLNALGIPHTRDANLDSSGFAAILRSAEAGNPEALEVIGRTYERGIIVGGDPVMAALYYIRAIRLDSRRGAELLWNLIQQENFFLLLKSRAARGESDAQSVWAVLRVLGYDMVMRQQSAYLTQGQALDLLQKPAERGHVQANIELGLLYYAGEWVPEDRELAIRYWKEAARAGSREAELRVAITTLRSTSDSVRQHRAIAIIGEAASQGALLAQVALGYCYETGTGVAKNIAEAVRLYRDGARRGSRGAFQALRRMHDDIRPDLPEYRLVD